MKTVNNGGITRAILMAGFATLTILSAGQKAAIADDGMEGHGRYVRSERIDIRHDEDRLHRLEYRIREELRCHDYTAARHTRFEILDARRDIDRDKREIERQRRESERDHHGRDRDRGGYRSHE